MREEGKKAAALVLSCNRRILLMEKRFEQRFVSANVSLKMCEGAAKSEEVIVEVTVWVTKAFVDYFTCIRIRTRPNICALHLESGLVRRYFGRREKKTGCHIDLNRDTRI